MKPIKKTILARICLSLATLLLTLGLLELAAHVYSRVRQGPDHLRDKITIRAEYLNPIGADRMNAARSRENRRQLHPLFGYVYYRSVHGANNYGFVADHDFEITTNGYAISGIDRS